MLKIIDKLFREKWFNFGYMAGAFIANLAVQGLGWGLVMVYLIGCALLDLEAKKGK